jgi:hypothetical protein
MKGRQYERKEGKKERKKGRKETKMMGVGGGYKNDGEGRCNYNIRVRTRTA